MATYTTNYPSWSDLEGQLAAAQSYISRVTPTVNSAINNATHVLSGSTAGWSGTMNALHTTATLVHTSGLTLNVNGIGLGSVYQIITSMGFSDGTSSWTMAGGMIQQSVAGTLTGTMTSFDYQSQGYSQHDVGRIPLDGSPIVITSWSSVVPSSLGNLYFSSTGTQTESSTGASRVSYSSITISDASGHSISLSNMNFSPSANSSATNYVDLVHQMLAQNDVANGGAGADELQTFGGNDTLNGGAGNDILNGGAGTDTAKFSAAAANYRVVSYNGEIAVLTAGADGHDRLFGIENLQFSDKSISSASVAAFDPLAYIASYPDMFRALGASGQAGFDHYINHGYAEGRTVSFDGFAYMAANPDLIQAFGTNVAAAEAHYINNGYAEGRHTTFDALAYIASYPDLIKAFGTNAAAAEAHYVTNGYAEGRHTTFDGLAYIASYPDLIKAFGTNATAAEAHYITNGYAEGRHTTFDGMAYIASNPDLINVFGTNATAAEMHYITNGYAEGRTVTIDGQSYVLANLDLLAAFGLDAVAGGRHYITNGIHEGRDTSLNSWQHGGTGNDSLTGTDGKDVLDGGAGQDTLTGGAGQDIFVLRGGDGGTALQLADVIADFQDGTDRLGLAGSLTYADLRIEQGTGVHAADTIVSTGSGEYLAILNNLLATNINNQDFVHF